MYVLSREIPYEYSYVVGVYDSIHKLKKALREQDIKYTYDADPDAVYCYTKTVENEAYIATAYFSIERVPINQFEEYGYEEIEEDINNIFELDSQHLSVENESLSIESANIPDIEISKEEGLAFLDALERFNASPEGRP